MEKRVTFSAHKIRLVGRLHEGHDQKGAIITHPHPLYGGDMDNTIVTTLADAYQKAGWSTLRFNFRGTGQSQGDFDDGIGEQEDLQGAIDFLQATGVQQVQLAGYSFGAWVLACWSQQGNPQRYPLFMVSPPVAFIEFPIGPLPGLQAVFTGRNDELAPPKHIHAHLAQWHPGATLTIIEKTDHFFGDQIEVLKQKFSQCIHTD